MRSKGPERHCQVSFHPSAGRSIGVNLTAAAFDVGSVADAEEFIPFLDCDIEIRRVLFSTNAIESLDARYRLRSVPVFGDASLDPTGKGQARWITRWKLALNAFAITFADRWPGSETY